METHIKTLLNTLLCASITIATLTLVLLTSCVIDVTGVELVESPPLVSRADPHNLPFFDGVFDLGTIRPGGVVVVVVEECDFDELGEIKSFFNKCDFVSARNVTLAGLRMTQIIMRNRVP
ncbi:hypothetical protein MKW94_012523 [Papaver nudicaule]|uniref:Uncharacterized protein n=1 Tax=Papaver nudicaule TaxID=74823 RepID=A0AA41V352_PAPNU|nr:hypothetical protein [Papaver nudicaule]